MWNRKCICNEINFPVKKFDSPKQMMRRAIPFNWICYEKKENNVEIKSKIAFINDFIWLSMALRLFWSECNRRGMDGKAECTPLTANFHFFIAIAIVLCVCVCERESERTVCFALMHNCIGLCECRWLVRAIGKPELERGASARGEHGKDHDHEPWNL